MNQDVSPEEKPLPVSTEKIPDENDVEEQKGDAIGSETQGGAESVGQYEALEGGARALAEKADAFVDMANRFSSWVKSRAPYGGFNVGEKIEQSDEFRTIRGNVEILNVEIPGYLSLVQKIVSGDGDIERMQQVAHRAFDDLGNDMAKAQQSAEDLYGKILRLKRQITDFHDGDESEDEEYLTSLVPIIRDIHDGSRQLRNECGRQQIIIDSLH